MSQMTTNIPTPGTPKPNLSISNQEKSNLSGTVKQLVKDLSEQLNVNGEEFVKEDFDLKSFTSSIIKTNILSEHLANLSQNINSLDKEIREQVSLHHEDLLHQAINIETLEDMLDMVQTRISSLKSTSERLRMKISTPYNELNLRILQLSRLQAACDTLRRIKGILHHSSKLRAHMHAGVKDIVKSAQCLNELDFLLRNFDASGIEVIEKDVHYAHKSRREVEEQAQVILDKSMVSQDQTQIGTSLQVFYSLGVLTQKLADALKTNEKNFQKISSELLDSTSLTLLSTSSSSATLNTSMSMSNVTNATSFPGRSTMPNIGAMSQFRAQLWTNVEKLMDSLYDSCSQIVQLEQIVEKKKDLLTNLFYIDEIDFSILYNGKMYLFNISNQQDNSSVQASPPLLVFEGICANIDPANELNSKKTIEFLYEQWRTLTNCLNQAIVTACNQSNYIKQTFQNEYPKLLKLQNDLWLRLIQLNPLIDRYRYPSVLSSANADSAVNKQVSKQGKNQSNVQQQSNQPSITTSQTFLSSYELLRKCFYDLENSYLNRSLSHLFDPINLIFSQTSTDKQINRSDIETFLKGIQSQLQTLQYDMFNSNQSAQLAVASITKSNPSINITLSGCSSAFSDKVVSNICKSIQMYANKAEQLLNSLNLEVQHQQQQLQNRAQQEQSQSSASMSFAASANTSSFLFSTLPSQIQTRNLDYVNVTHDLYEQMSRMFENEKLNKKLEDRLNQALKSLWTFEENALNPFIQSASDCILAILLTMHNEDFINPQSQTCSLYMRELQQVLQRICRDYLQQYQCKSILNVYLVQLGARCIDLFIRHASILRPMTDATRQRLLNDSQQIEIIVQTLLCNKLTDLGLVYKQLKAFRHLLQSSSPLQISSDQQSSSGNNVVDESHYSHVLDESLPYHVLLHYLFSYAPIELKSPHQSLDWQIARYSEWLDKHRSEKERLMVIKTCLETYVNLVKQKKEKQFAPIYPLMSKLLEKGLQNVLPTASA